MLFDENNTAVDGRAYDMPPEQVIAVCVDHFGITMHFVAANEIKAELLQSVGGAHD